jgi:long-chain acyl-CoA synthetase
LPRVYFITGGTGLVGSELVRRILAWDPGAEIHLLVRGRVPAISAHRVATLLETIAPGDRHARDRVHTYSGDLTQPDLGLAAAARDALAEKVTHIIHCAADVRFDLPLETARSINFAGTVRVFELARRAAARGRLARYTQVSTYTVGRPEPGSMTVLETPVPTGVVARTTYERSKAETEAYLLLRRGEVPLVICRPSTIVGDSRNGYTQDFKVGYVIMRLYADGLLPDVLPCTRDAVTDCVHLDEVCDATYALSVLPDLASGAIFHLAAGRGAFDTARVLERAAAAVRAELLAAGRPAPRPLVCEVLPQVTPEMLRARVADPEALATLVSFLPYLSNRLRYDDGLTHQALGTSVTRTSFSDTVPQRMRFCVESDWGRIAMPRAPLAPAPRLPGVSR